MTFENWTPAFRQGIIDRMANGETARQLSREFGVSRSNLQKLYDDSQNEIANKKQAILDENKAILDSIIENNQIIQFKDEYLKSIWRGFLKQNEAVTMKHAYSSPDHNYYVDTCAPKWAKELVKERWLTHTSFELLDNIDKTAIGMVIKDIRNYGKKRNI